MKEVLQKEIGCAVPESEAESFLSDDLFCFKSIFCENPATEEEITKRIGMCCRIVAQNNCVYEGFLKNYTVEKAIDLLFPVKLNLSLKLSGFVRRNDQSVLFRKEEYHSIHFQQQRPFFALRAEGIPSLDLSNLKDDSKSEVRHIIFLDSNILAQTWKGHSVEEEASSNADEREQEVKTEDKPIQLVSSVAIKTEEVDTIQVNIENKEQNLKKLQSGEDKINLNTSDDKVTKSAIKKKQKKKAKRKMEIKKMESTGSEKKIENSQSSSTKDEKESATQDISIHVEADPQIEKAPEPSIPVSVAPPCNSFENREEAKQTITEQKLSTAAKSFKPRRVRRLPQQPANEQVSNIGKEVEGAFGYKKEDLNFVQSNQPYPPMQYYIPPYLAHQTPFNPVAPYYQMMNDSSTPFPNPQNVEYYSFDLCNN